MSNPPYPPLRNARPFGMPQTPFNPRTGKHLPLGDSRVVEVFTIDEVLENALRCSDRRGKSAIVVKPSIFRPQVFDGETIDGVTYTLTSTDLRSATDGSETENQRVTPSYVVGETILAIRVRQEVSDQGQDIVSEWEDLNNAGRCWAVDTEAT